MQTNLPPLEHHHVKEWDGSIITGPKWNELNHDQAALVIDIVEVRYPKLVEALEVLAGKRQGKIHADNCCGICHCERVFASNALASLESK